MSAPYKRIYKHTGPRGKEKYISCGFCGRLVPRYKTITIYKSFGISDPYLKKEMNIRAMPLKRKFYVCPQCARHRGIVKIGKSRKSRPLREE